MKHRLLVTFALIPMILFQIACAPNLNGLKETVKAFGPLIAFEAEQHHIPADKVKLYTDDGNLLIDDFGQLVTAWNAATTNVQKGLAAGTFATQVLPIANDFKPIPRLNEAMLILTATVATIRAFYGGPGAAPGVAHIPANEKELKDYIAAQNKALKAALGVR